MAVHVAEAADIHKNVEAELLAGREDAQQFVVTSSMTQAEVDDLLAMRLPARLDHFANLPVRIMTVRVDERGREFDLECVIARGFVIQQINQWRRLNVCAT